MRWRGSLCTDSCMLSTDSNSNQNVNILHVIGHSCCIINCDCSVTDRCIVVDYRIPTYDWCIHAYTCMIIIYIFQIYIHNY